MNCEPPQIRAARALLNWSQSHLAERAGVSQVTVANLETGRIQGSRSTLAKIETALEHEGIEFIGNGVRRREEYLGFFAGPDAYLRLLDDVYFTIGASKGEVLFSGADERKNFDGVEERMKRLVHAGVRYRVLIEEGNTHILGKLSHYRQIPSQYFSNGVTVIYGDKYAILVVLEDGPRVHILNNLHIAEAQRKIFEFLWTRGLKPYKSEMDARY